MYRGTTPTLTLSLETKLNLENIKRVWVTLRSKTFEKTFENYSPKMLVDSDNKKIYLYLSQEDTLYFRDNVNCQVRILLNNEKAYASNIKVISLNQILKDGVIT